jgi:hypothetical protein
VPASWRQLPPLSFQPTNSRFQHPSQPTLCLHVDVETLRRITKDGQFMKAPTKYQNEYVCSNIGDCKLNWPSIGD